MVLGLFGKKKATEQKFNQPSAPDIELERQRKLVNMQKALEEIREEIEVKYLKVDQMDAQAKNLIRKKKKNEAKRQLRVLKIILEYLARQENMCIMLERTKIKTEATGDACGLTFERYQQSLQKEAEKKREFFEDFLVKKREIDEYYKEIDKLLSDNATGDEEKIQEMYNELEQEVFDEQMDNINNNPFKKATKPQVQTHT